MSGRGGFALSVCLMLASAVHATASGYGPGDVLVALTNGTVQVRSADGVLKATIAGPVQAPAKGLAFDLDGNLLVS